MTSDEFPKSFWGRVVELSKVASAVVLLLGMAGGAYSVTWGPLRALIIEVVEEWEQMQTNIANLQRDMLIQQGETKVIREVPGLTYVSEPVYQNERITFNYVASRTQLGVPCILQNSKPIFTDMQNTPTPGPAIPAQIQLSQNPTPLRPEFEVPINIRPGRVTVYVVLEYNCDGRTMFDQTTVAAFELLRGPRPAKSE